MTANQINYQRVLNDRRSIRETERSNRSREQETHRSNRAQEYETHRSNIVKERETNRHNLVDEGTKSAAEKSKSFKNYAGGARDIVGILQSILNPAQGTKDMVASIFGA